MRTPLNSILGFAQLLVHSPAQGMTSQEREYVQNIHISGSLLLDLIDRLLDLSKAESGEADVKLEPTDVAMCLEKARAVLDPLAKQAGIKLSIDPGAFEGMMVMADPTRLTQIFINLGTNAIKYNKPGGRVDVRLGTTSLKDLVVSFIDTGIGIPATYRGQVFQAFNRLHQSKSSVPGAGIGLALSRRFAEAMGAILSFDSAEDAGSSFDLKLQRC
jgi:signal transduction histidine kinase